MVQKSTHFERQTTFFFFLTVAAGRFLCNVFLRARYTPWRSLRIAADFRLSKWFRLSQRFIGSSYPISNDLILGRSQLDLKESMPHLSVAGRVSPTAKEWKERFEDTSSTKWLFPSKPKDLKRTLRETSTGETVSVNCGIYKRCFLVWSLVLRGEYGTRSFVESIHVSNRKEWNVGGTWQDHSGAHSAVEIGGKLRRS